MAICGIFYIVEYRRIYLPQVAIHAHTSILSSLSRTTLTQTFVNPAKDVLKDLRYVFPLYDGSSVVAFTCTIGDRTIKGVVQERAKAKKTFKDAVDRGETAGLLEQLPESSDVFSTSLGNVPANATLKVEITYLNELKADMGIDGLRFTIPTAIAPRYGETPAGLDGTLVQEKGIEIVVDAELPEGQNIRSIQSPSHQLAVSIGHTSKCDSGKVEPSFRKASATLALKSTELDKDFVLQLVASNTGDPVAFLEKSSTIEGHQAIMATLVPKFSLPADRPEVVIVCDRSGSMSGRIPGLITSTKLFLKSLPVGVKFNICSFGSHHDFLWDRSQPYSEETLEKAMKHADTLDANYGGTEMHRPLEDVFKRRYNDMNLEVFVLTDGEIWNQESLFAMINEKIAESKGAIRVFSLGIGNDVSHSLIEGLARAGNGFSQAVADGEKMDAKVVRMLKGALTPHIKDYSLEVQYHDNEKALDVDDDFEMVGGSPALAASTPPTPSTPASTTSSKTAGSIVKKVISLFDPKANPDDEIIQPGGDKYSGIPDVPPPKILQTPHNIPPLFPFSRTSVYLLLPPSSTGASRTPKSVILRGTSTHGPLELEIALTHTTGETIHQLAARKAMQELEEGRGWLVDAKDAKGKLLKAKHEGRFSDMVEREAVRLGETFQVAGKWCSFVAVEGDKMHPESEAKVVTPAAEEASYERSDLRAFSMPSKSKKSASSVFKGGPGLINLSSSSRGGGVRSDDRSRVDTRSASPQRVSERGLHSAARTRMIPGMAGGGGSGLMSIGGAPAPAPRRAMASTTSAGNFFGTFSRKSGAPPAPAMAPGGPMPPPPPAPACAPAEMRELAVAPALDRSEGGADYDDKCEEEEDDGFAAPAISKEEAPAGYGSSGVPADALERLVALQSFVGSWAWDGQLQAALGVTQAKVEGALAKTGTPWAEKLRADGLGNVVATALVLRFLKEKMGADKEAWEMVAEKAALWLEGQVGGPSGATAEDVEGVFAGIF